MSKRNLYLLIIVLALGGYAWVIFQFNVDSHNHSGICLTKNITGLPCPACGSTRAVMSILSGDFLQAFKINPFGFIITTVLFLFPIWVLVDMIRKADSFYLFYIKSENLFRKRLFILTGGLIVLLNWIWNINKGL